MSIGQCDNCYEFGDCDCGREPPPVADVCVRAGLQPFGATNWAGTYNGYPALTLSWWSGAALFYFKDGTWQARNFKNFAECVDMLGLDVTSAGGDTYAYDAL